MITFSLLSRNYFVQSSTIRTRPVFIGAGKSVGPLESNFKRAEVGIVSVDEYHEML